MYFVHHLVRSLTILAGACLVVTGLAGCAEDPAAVTPTDLPYSLYGIINPASDTQKVRVYPIEPRLQPADGSPLDASVTSTDLVTGEVIEWQDSILAFGNGSYGYLYWAAFRPTGGHPLRLSVTRSDGAQSSATVAVPLAPEQLEPEMFAGVLVPITLGGSGAQLLKIDVAYSIAYGWQAAQRKTYTFPYVHLIRPDEYADRFDIALDADYRAIVDSLRRKLEYNPEYNVVPEIIEFRARVTDADWVPPDGEFDPEVIIEPGVFNNVENGFGFLGSGYDVWQEIELSDAVIEAAGFTAIEPPPPPPDKGPPPTPLN